MHLKLVQEKESKLIFETYFIKKVMKKEFDPTLPLKPWT